MNNYYIIVFGRPSQVIKKLIATITNPIETGKKDFQPSCIN